MLSEDMLSLIMQHGFQYPVSKSVNWDLLLPHAKVRLGDVPCCYACICLEGKHKLHRFVEKSILQNLGLRFPIDRSICNCNKLSTTLFICPLVLPSPCNIPG